MTVNEILKEFEDINHYYNDCTKYETLERMLNELTAQPELIMCKDCKFVKEMASDGTLWMCGIWHDYTDADGFCYEAERRTDETN